MPVFQKLVNFDEMFSQLREPPLIINNLLNSTDEEKLKVRDLITTKYSSDMLSILPSCQCGKTKGEHTVGTKCIVCGSVVRSVIDENIEPLVWFSAPKGVLAMINPIIWTMLKNRFKKSGFSIIQWICDTTYNPRIRQPKIINDLIEMGIQRGYNNFITNFDRIMEMLFSIRELKTKKTKVDYLANLIRDYRDCIFSQYLPLPNKSLLIIEKTNMGIYVDRTVVGAIDAIEMVVNIDSELTDHSVRVKENRTVKAIAKLAEFYEGFIKTNLSGKPGVYRKHMFGSRVHHSFRTVVTSLTGDHKYDEIHIPWGVAMTAFRTHLMNKLLRRGFSHNDAVGYLYGHVEKHNQMLEDIFNELLAEKQPTVILQRNPSLLQGSAQTVRISKVKTNVNDKTVSMSILIVKAPNAD